MRIPLTFALLSLLIACGEDKQETAVPADTAACVTEAEILTVCNCALVVSWDTAVYTVEKVVVMTMSLTATELQDALCEDGRSQADVGGFINYNVDIGDGEVSVDALSAPAFITIQDHEGVLGVVIVDPSGDETENTVSFE